MPPETPVYYCYTVHNTGKQPLSAHTLRDDQLGVLLSSLNQTLPAGATQAFVKDPSGRLFTATIAITTTNVATWTAHTDTQQIVTATAAATVNVLPLAIELTKTVGVFGQGPACASQGTITVDHGTTVAYCYTVTNTGAYTLSVHSLVDDKLGEILNNRAATLAPGASLSTIDLGVVVTTTLDLTTTNVATWTATLALPVSAAATHVQGVSVTAMSAAKVNVKPEAPTALDPTDQPFPPGHDIFLPVINNGQ